MIILISPLPSDHIIPVLPRRIRKTKLANLDVLLSCLLDDKAKSVSFLEIVRGLLDKVYDRFPLSMR